MQTVDPGDLAEGVGSVEDHHEADRTPRPGDGSTQIRLVNTFSVMKGDGRTSESGHAAKRLD